MPIYEYQCEDCGYQMEKLQKMSDAPLKDCPECAKPALRKLVSAAAFKLKGTGWYETDFKDNNKSDKTKEKGKENASKTAEPGKKDTSAGKSSDTSKSTKTEKKAKPAAEK